MDLCIQATGDSVSIVLQDIQKYNFDRALRNTERLPRITA